MNGDKGLSITMTICILVYENSGKPGCDQKYDDKSFYVNFYAVVDNNMDIFCWHCLLVLYIYI